MLNNIPSAGSVNTTFDNGIKLNISPLNNETNSPKINQLKPIVAKMDFEEIDPVQREINKMMGISDEEFMEYSCKASDSKSPLISDTQREINERLGISDEEFLEYSCKTPVY